MSSVKANPSKTRWEKAVFLFLAMVVVALKICYVFVYRYNSDEAQHLHVAWGWTQGMVQYRDFFDNHAPLFHILMAPLVKCLGERADILFWMRLSMLPLWGTALWCVYCLGARLYSPRAGRWAVLLGAANSVLLLKATEFRADTLWMLAWVATIAVALGGPFARKRAAATGFLAGITLAISMKTTVLLAGAIGSLGIVFACLPAPERKRVFAGSSPKALAAVGGCCIVPLAIMGFFASRGALPNLYYCIIKHNTLTGNGMGMSSLLRGIKFAIGLGLLWKIAKMLLRNDEGSGLALRRAMVFLSASLYLALLHYFWPLETAQDFLPAVPLLTVSLAPMFLRLETLPNFWSKISLPLLAAAVIVQVSYTVHSRWPFRFSLQETKLLQDVVRLTNLSDFVMDAKGGTVFRQRPFYYVLETLTQKRMDRGLLSNTITEDMVGKGTCVTLLDRLPEKTLRWVKRFYLPVTDQIHVAGCFLPPGSRETEPAPRRFEVAIPTKYVVLSATGAVPGTMDGVPCFGPVFLTPGWHSFSYPDFQELAICWAQAAEKGFNPFSIQCSSPTR